MTERVLVPVSLIWALIEKAQEGHKHELSEVIEVRALIDPPTIVTGMRVAYLMGGDERIVGEFHDGAWDLIIPGTEKSRMSVEPEVFWETVRLVTGPSVEDMAPGTTFTAEGVGVPDSSHRFTVTDKFSPSGYRYLRCTTHDGNGAIASYVDPATIRNITPPEETS